MDILRSVSTFEVQAYEWLWKPFIPLGEVTLLLGGDTVGKTSLLMNLAAALTSGTALPDGQSTKEAQSVIFQTVENSYNKIIHPGVKALGGDVVNHLFCIDPEDNYNKKLLMDDDRLEACVCEGDVKLLILDPIEDFVESPSEIFDPGMMRRYLTPLVNLAQKSGIAIVLTESRGSRYGEYDSCPGIRDIMSQCRNVIMLSQNDLDPNVKYLTMEKTNITDPYYAEEFRAELKERFLKFQYIGSRPKTDLRKDQNPIQLELEETKAFYCGKRILEMVSGGPVLCTSITNVLRQELGEVSDLAIFEGKTRAKVESIRRKQGWYWRANGDQREPLE